MKETDVGRNGGDVRGVSGRIFGLLKSGEEKVAVFKRICRGLLGGEQLVEGHGERMTSAKTEMVFDWIGFVVFWLLLGGCLVRYSPDSKRWTCCFLFFGPLSRAKRGILSHKACVAGITRFHHLKKKTDKKVLHMMIVAKKPTTHGVKSVH